MGNARSSVCGFLLALVLVVALAPPAMATYSDEPSGPAGWVPDGPVRAVEVAGGRVLVGGGFTGGVAALDASTGQLLWTGNVSGGPVRALALSADGTRVIVGGAFTSAGGATHRGLASMRVADGAVEPDWRAGALGAVRDIVVHGDVAYFGGTFARHDGLDQRGLGAVRVSSGEPVADFDLAVGHVDDVTRADVYGLATDGARLFVAGRFTDVDGVPRNQLASVTLATHSLDAWAPARACTGCNLVWDVLVDGGTVYTAGRNPNAVAAYTATTAVRRWRVSANGDAQALTLADGKLYAGGHFTEIGDPRQPRTIMAALDPATGAIDPDFWPRFVTTWPGIWALAATGDRLYAAGDFTVAGSVRGQYPYFAMFASDGSNTAPVAEATATPPAVEVGDPVTFSAAGSSDAETPDDLTYSWDFGNGGTAVDATGESVTHTYGQAGQYTARVTVTDPQGASDTAIVEVLVSAPPPPNTAPTAQAAADPSSAETGQTITFSAAGSTDAESPGDLVYRWDFGNGGSTVDATGETVTHAYQQAGQFRARLTVSDPQGASDTATVDVVVEVPNTAPTAQAAADPSSAETGQTITFSAAGSTDAETPGDLVYRWDLGNGGTTADATGQMVTHAYQEAGQYVATVTVTDPDGMSDSATVAVLVDVPDTTAPRARLRSSPRLALAGADLTFTGAGSRDDITASDDLTYAWRIGKRPDTMTGEQVTVQFANPGIRRVHLTVTDEAGNTDTVTHRVQVRSFVHCRSPRVERAGGWRVRSGDGAMGGSYCDSRGARPGPDVVSFRFRGPDVTVVHGDARSGGIARVSVDGERQRVISFRGTEQAIDFWRKRSYRGLGPGEHTIRIEMRDGTGFLEGFVHRG